MRAILLRFGIAILVFAACAQIARAAPPLTIEVEAYIDGLSHLILRGNAAQWHHVTFAAPGRHDIYYPPPPGKPTVINGAEWYPSWPAIGGNRVESCDCLSLDTFTFPGDGVPAASTIWTLQVIEVEPGGGTAYIAEQPTGANSFALVITFNDISPSGPHYIRIRVTAPPARTVGLDIKPFSYPNSINAGNRGVIPVAVLSDPAFDATTQVNRTSLTFGRTGNEASLVSCAPGGQDVNYDGRPDLICHFDTTKTGFMAGDTLGVLKGLATDGTLFVGSDRVRIVPAK